DMRFYNDWAQRILHGQLTDHLAFFGLPLYAYLLAFFYKLFGYNPFLPALAQCALDAGTAVFIYQIALRLFNDKRTIGILAALGWAFFIPAQAYALVIMPTSWMIFVFWLVVWSILKSDLPFTAAKCFFLGCLVGCTAT